ncbi:MarR family winged helix-turn-helix transcriptional regulator [Leifsonia aquatica]|uniref:MarR family winged helix-turn-helix transcriptional regulator n=1 Tax=Leifsonia aquatica TaxID=144185 RepID=UPI0004694DC5|nr:MarR family winged helix-turn-helix transcriptional regulator [Leifsonia aquatica]
MTRPDAAVPPRTAFLLAQVGASAADRFQERVAALGLTARAAGAIRIIGQRPGISQREVAHALGAPPSRIVSLLDELASAGLVDRERNETDRRNNALSLTGEGRAMLGRLRTVAEEHQAEVLDVLAPDERVALAALLQKLSTGTGLTPDGHPGYRA